MTHRPHRNLNATLGDGGPRMDLATDRATMQMLNTFDKNFVLSRPNGRQSFAALSPDSLKEERLHNFLGGYLNKNRPDMAPGLSADMTSTGLTRKMQASFGWTDASKLGLTREEIHAVKAMSADEMKAAQSVLKHGKDGGTSFDDRFSAATKADDIDPAIKAKFETPFANGKGAKSSLSKVMDKLQAGIADGPVPRAKALDDVHALHVIDGVSGPVTKSAWSSFVNKEGTTFANLAATQMAPVAAPHSVQNLRVQQSTAPTAAPIGQRSMMQQQPKNGAEAMVMAARDRLPGLKNMTPTADF